MSKVNYSKVHDTELVSPSVAAASAALTEYLVLTTVVSVLFSDDELPPEEPPEEPPDDGPSHGGEGHAKQVPILTMLKKHNQRNCLFHKFSPFNIMNYRQPIDFKRLKF